MIVFDLECRAGGHRFEGWFASSNDFAAQQERGFVACPECGSADVIKAPMAPKLARKGNQLSNVPTVVPADVPPAAPAPRHPMTKGAMPPEAVQVMRALASMQAEALKDSRWVGDKFAEQSRAMHYGERDAEAIHGQATPEDAAALFEEGIEVMPLPFPVAPPGEAN
jgi:hypothetical protein